MLNKKLLLSDSAVIYTGASLTLNLISTIPTAVELAVVEHPFSEVSSVEYISTEGVYIRPFMEGHRYLLYVDTSQVFILNTSNIYDDVVNYYYVGDTQKDAYLEVHLRSGGGSGN